MGVDTTIDLRNLVVPLTDRAKLPEVYADLTTLRDAIDNLAAAINGILSGTLTSSGGNVVLGTPESKLEVKSDGGLEINAGGVGNRFAYVDFHGDDTYPDYSLRILRNNGGPDTTTNIVHRGTGDVIFEGPDMSAASAYRFLSGSGTTVGYLSRSFASIPVPLIVGGNSPEAATAYLTRGADSNFQLWAINGVAANTAYTSVAQFGMSYQGSVTLSAGFSFVRGLGTADTQMDVRAGNAVVNSFRPTGAFRFVPRTLPSDAVAGDVVFDTATLKLQCWNGSSWNALW